MADVLIDADLVDFAEFEVLAPSGVLTPPVVSADHIEWGFAALEGEAQGGGAP